MNEFDYEIAPTMMEEDGWVKCEESTADQWSVYERPTEPDETGARLAVWVADFARKEDALAFVELLSHD
jgi:hypothetical protein